jgi:methyl-accepting chemotaxis protein
MPVPTLPLLSAFGVSEALHSIDGLYAVVLAIWNHVKAEGRLTMLYSEVKILQTSFNNCCEAMHEGLGAVSDNVVDILHYVSELITHCSSLSETVNDVHDVVEDIPGTLDDIKETVEAVADSVDNISSSVSGGNLPQTAGNQLITTGLVRSTYTDIKWIRRRLQQEDGDNSVFSLLR